MFSWTVIHRALHPGFTPDVPYATVIIEMAEGVRMVSHMLDLNPEQLRVGLPVAVVFDDVTPEVTLPKISPSPTAWCSISDETGHKSPGPPGTCA